MVEPILNDPTREVGYAIQRNGLLAAGKQLAEAAGHFWEQALGTEVVTNLVPAAGALKGIGGLVTIGLAAGVSSALTQMDYLHRKDNLANLYKEEIAAKLGKSAGHVKAADLDKVAEENPTLKEEMNRSLKQRNYGFGLSFIASMSALAVIKLALPSVLVSAGIAGFAAVAVSALVGVITYNAVKAPLHVIADKMFGLDDRTTNDVIVGIKRAQHAGKTISREQVLSVFVAANPELSQNIIAQYGKHYDSLDADSQHKVATEVNSIIPLDKMTLDINQHKLNVTELAFAAEGQVSGVDHDHHEAIKKSGMLREMWNGMVDVELPVKIKRRHVTAHAEASVTYNVADPAHIMALVTASEPPQEEHLPKASFISKLGLSKKDPQHSHVQQLEQASNDPSIGLSQ